MATIAFSVSSVVVAKATTAGRTQRTVSRVVRPMLKSTRSMFYSKSARVSASRQSVRVMAKGMW